MSHLAAMGERANVVVQVLPWTAGLHGLTNTDVMFVRGPGGRTVAWVETGCSGELVQATTPVEQLQLRYDRVRGLALSPEGSRQFIGRMSEEASCESST
ncbi:Scr1 family TA system antitoxin-like transcriptional regulator [Streptomyces sp. NPDC017260]|uniref:Scr1 family TA system antitoxin-like transcriptional regulator n=1 Tax=unclassified Streptomyces TaxID=2593676 RepID=UPI0037924CC6